MDASYSLGPVGSNSAVIMGDNNTVTINGATPYFHFQLDEIRRLIEQNMVKTALKELARLRNFVWNNADNDVRYRILHYEGFSLLKLLKNSDAAQKFFDAYNLNSNDLNANAFRCLAFLLIGDRKNAFDFAQEILKREPSNSLAYQVLVQAASDDLGYDGCLALIPEPYLNQASVQYAIARRMRNIGERELSRKHINRTLALDKSDPSGEGHSLLGTILLEDAFFEIKSVRMTRKTAERIRLVEDAEAIFSEAWQRVEGTELDVVGVLWLQAISKMRSGFVAG